MAASINDLITRTRNGARPSATTVTSTRAVAGTTLACGSLAGWPTASAVHFVTYKIDTSNEVIAGTQCDWKGIVSGTNITNLTLKDGTDVGNAIGDVVEMLPTAAWGEDLAEGLEAEHNRNGTHAAITATSLTSTGAVSGTTGTFSGAVSGAAATFSGTLTANGSLSGITPAKFQNPYKFSVYRNAARNSGNGAFAAMNPDTKVFDTGSNVDIVTNVGRFTAPVTGFYAFNASAYTTAGSSAHHSLLVALYKNGSEVARGSNGNTFNGLGSSVISDVLQLSATDYVEVYVYGDTTLALQVGASTFNRFSGFLISSTQEMHE